MRAIQVINRFTALIIGEAGIGKTSLIRTIPEDERAFVLSAEGGLLSVRDMVNSGRIEGVEISSIEELQEAYNMLITDEYKQKYKWVFLDSLTEIGDRCMTSLEERFARAKIDNGYKLWGEYLAVMTGLIKAFRDMPHYKVVFTCLPEYTEDELKRRYYAPLVQGKLKSRLTSYFDFVFFMLKDKDAEGEYRYFLTSGDERYPAKARCWKADQLEVREKPDLAYISAKIEGKED